MTGRAYLPLHPVHFQDGGRLFSLAEERDECFVFDKEDASSASEIFGASGGELGPRWPNDVTHDPGAESDDETDEDEAYEDAVGEQRADMDRRRGREENMPWAGGAAAAEGGEPSASSPSSAAGVGAGDGGADEDDLDGLLGVHWVAASGHALLELLSLVDGDDVGSFCRPLGDPFTALGVTVGEASAGAAAAGSFIIDQLAEPVEDLADELAEMFGEEAGGAAAAGQAMLSTLQDMEKHSYSYCCGGRCTHLLAKEDPDWLSKERAILYALDTRREHQIAVSDSELAWLKMPVPYVIASRQFLRRHLRAGYCVTSATLVCAAPPLGAYIFSLSLLQSVFLFCFLSKRKVVFLLILSSGSLPLSSV
jgi:hypothetical protein